MIRIRYLVFNRLSSIVTSQKKKLMSKYFMCQKKIQDKQSSVNSHEQLKQPNNQPQQIKITKQQIALMHQFMSNPNLSAPDLSVNEKTQKLIVDKQLNSSFQGYFNNDEQLVSLAVLKFNHPLQFLPYFKKYTLLQNQTDNSLIALKLIVLYQYCKLGGKVSVLKKENILDTKITKIEDYAFLCLRQLLTREAMEQLNEQELQKLLILYNQLNCIQQNKYMYLLPNKPPLLKNYTQTSTSLLKILVQSYNTDVKSVNELLKHYFHRNKSEKIVDPNASVRRFSCWQMFNVYLVVHKLESQCKVDSTSIKAIQDLKFKMKLNQYLLEIGKNIVQQFSAIMINQNVHDSSGADNEQDEEDFIKYSPISFLQYFIINLKLLEPSQLATNWFYQSIVTKNLDQSGQIKKMPLQILFHLLYTTVVSYQQISFSQKKLTQRKLKTIFDLLHCQILEKLSNNQSKTVSFNNYVILWKSIMIIHKVKLIQKQGINKIMNLLIKQSLSQEFVESLITVPQYAEQFSKKQNQLFNMLVTYRLIILPQLLFEQYSEIYKQIKAKRVLLRKFLVQIRQIYQTYHLSGLKNDQSLNNMVITSMIANAYSYPVINQQQQQLKQNNLYSQDEQKNGPIDIFLSHTIKQSLLEYSQSDSCKYAHYIEALLKKY